MTAVWSGMDSGKWAHHCVVIDAAGRVLLSRRVANDEAALGGLITAVLELADGDQAVWATDLNAGGAALLLAMLADRDQRVLYLPGRLVHHAAATYRGDGKTDAKDARIIADQARMRTDLQPVRAADQISVDLRLLTSRRTDMIFDRVRHINRLRATMLEYFPALEAAFDYSKKAPLILVAGYQTPDGIRRMGVSRLAVWLRGRGARGADTVAAKAVQAAAAQRIVLASQAVAAQIVAKLAHQIMALDSDIAVLDEQIQETFDRHRDAKILLSMPGFGVVLGATFLANTAGNVTAFNTVDRLASVAGLAPVAARFRPDQRQSPPTPPIQPTTTANLLPGRVIQPEGQPRLEGVLRPQTRRGQVPQAGDHRARPTPAQHDLGHDP